MPDLDRRLCRPFLTLARRAFGLSAKRTGDVNVTIQAGPAGAALRAAHFGVLLTYGEADAADESGEAVTVPLSLLAELAGGKADAVTLERADDGAVVRWMDRGVPRTRRVGPLDPVPAPPALPTLCDPGPGFAAALAACAAVTDEGSARYALGCVRLRAADGDAAGADGRQLLVCDGFRFGFAGEVLLPRPALLASAELAGPLRLGLADQVIVLRRGPWTVWLPPGEGRFPKVEAVLPQAAAAVATVEFDADDLAFLAARIGGLPGSGDSRPVTLDLAAGRTLVRGRDADGGGGVELLLARSPAAGDALRLATNRDYLARAAALGLTRLHLFGPDRPALGVGPGRRFVWMPLDGVAESGPAAGVVRLSSAEAAAPSPVSASARQAAGRQPVVEAPLVNTPVIHEPVTEPAPMPDPRNDHQTAVPHAAVSQGTEESDESLDALIRRAEATHDTLADAARDVRKLAAALKKRRRGERLMRTTLEGLHKLRTLDAA